MAEQTGARRWRAAMVNRSRQIAIVLNGAGSVGKSSTARAVQEIASVPLVYVAMDSFLEMLPERMFGHPDGLVFRRLESEPHPTIAIESGEVCRRLLFGMRHAIAAMARHGISLIVDDVMLDGEAAEYRQLLQGLEVRIVGLFAPLEVLEQRERLRGDREIGLARWQFGRLHRGVDYDVELDAAAFSPEQNARRICEAFDL